MEGPGASGDMTGSVWLGPATLCLLVVVTAILGALVPFTLLEDSFGLRLWYQFRGVAAAPQDVVIVALESRSSRALGLPNRPDRWPRRLHADLVRGLTAQGASAVVFDLQFDRPREPEDDQAFALAISESGRVLLGAYMMRDQQSLNADGVITLNTDRLLEPLPALAQGAYAVAPFPLPKTQYGMRNFWLFVPSAGDEATLALAAGAMLQPDKYRRLYTQATGQQPPARMSTTQLRKLRAVLPVDHVFNLYGPPGTIRTINYDQALARLSDPADKTFHNKLVLVGFSEFNQPESRDAYATAYSGADGLEMSGVELMATAMANLLHEDWLRHPGTLVWMLVLAAFGCALVLPWFWYSANVALFLGACAGVLYLLTGMWLFREQVWLPLMVPLAVQLPLLSGVGLLLQHRRGSRRIARMRDTINRYLPGAEIQRLLQKHRSPDGEIEVVCLCADIVGYTTLAEFMSAQELRQWLNDHLEALMRVITEHEGHVVDITGDAVLAVWAPQPDAKTACSQAVRAAGALQGLEQTLGIASRIGIHYGPVSFGEVGARAHMELRAVGDAVNTTSRLQGAAKQLETQVLISAEVATRLADTSVVKPLGKLQLAGRQQPIDVYAPKQAAVPAWEHVRVLENK
jgi:adenylate cyclase